jgi:hypothetical protein
LLLNQPLGRNQVFVWTAEAGIIAIRLEFTFNRSLRGREAFSGAEELEYIFVALKTGPKSFAPRRMCQPNRDTERTEE